jgi:hypothetical protein
MDDDEIDDASQEEQGNQEADEKQREADILNMLVAYIHRFIPSFSRYRLLTISATILMTRVMAKRTRPIANRAL